MSRSDGPWHIPIAKNRRSCRPPDYANVLISYMPHNRKHIRLRDYDYSWQNAYFITICTKDHKNLFCDGVPSYISTWEPETMLSAIGKIAEKLLLDIPVHFPHVIIDEFTVMPNHIHCIFILDDTPSNSSNDSKQQAPMVKQGVEQFLPKQNQFGKPVKGSISVAIGQFKDAVTRWCNDNGHPYFNWQSKFHDHVIRDAKSHESIRFYIQNNAKSWNADEMCARPPN